MISQSEGNFSAGSASLALLLSPYSQFSSFACHIFKEASPCQNCHLLLHKLCHLLENLKSLFAAKTAETERAGLIYYFSFNFMYKIRLICLICGALLKCICKISVKRVVHLQGTNVILSQLKLLFEVLQIEWFLTEQVECTRSANNLIEEHIFGPDSNQRICKNRIKGSSISAGNYCNLKSTGTFFEVLQIKQFLTEQVECTRSANNLSKEYFFGTD